MKNPRRMLFGDFFLLDGSKISSNKKFTNHHNAINRVQSLFRVDNITNV